MHRRKEENKEVQEKESKMVDIPFDVITEILSWVPARSLLRFRCVCRSWYGLLHQPVFINLHLLRANESNPTLSILYNHTNKTCYCVDPETSDEPVKLKNLPLNYVSEGCNGLVCTSQGRSIKLLNPATREYKELPPPVMDSRALELDYFAVIGLGWDTIKDDYKVLGIFSSNHKMRLKDTYQLVMYTLRTNSWREIRQSTYPIRFCVPACSKFFNGGLHWMVTARDSDEVIGSFDMGKEVYKEINLPEHKTNGVLKDMGVLQGCLSVLCNLICEERIDIWIMRRYGDEGSWHKQFSIQSSLVPSYDLGIGLVGFQRTKLVLARFRGLISYNTETGSVGDVEICGSTLNWTYFHRHVETLVSLKAYGNTYGCKNGIM